MQELKCQPENSAKGVVLGSSYGKRTWIHSQPSDKRWDFKIRTKCCSGGLYGANSANEEHDQGKIVQEATPGFPIEAIGFHKLPQAGDAFLYCDR